MSARPKTTLEQWRMFQAVVDCGGYAQAADKLNKSQSSLNHAVTKLQDMLGVQLLEVRGRKAFLTDAGRIILHRSRQLTGQILALEELAANLDQGWEAEIRVAVEAIYPRAPLYQAIAQFYPQSRGSRVILKETILTATQEAIRDGWDLVITPHVPTGFLSAPLCGISLHPYCHPQHPLTELSALTEQDLVGHLQIVIMDNAQQPTMEIGWLKAGQRWSVSHFYEARSLLREGMGFAWLPDHLVADDLAAGRLHRLPVQFGGERRLTAQMMLPRGEQTGPGARALASLITQADHALYPASAPSSE
ncbi:LysR family transcriptional regulator [Plesiomonas shigelloides]|uniref:LysR family transcriptional regulator n=1 Tax=Plesiomonas shigelloides TaxID=703 RepID=UPI0032605A96